MHIKSGLVYNKSSGIYEGFSDFGQDVFAFDTDDVAKEALVFMLVGMRGPWKCPCGYVLYQSITLSNISHLVQKVLEISSLHDLNIYSVTYDGARANVDAMRFLGCEFGTKLPDIVGSCSCDFFDHKLFFIADACHMLKLARNALADLKVFIDNDGKAIKWDHISCLQKLQEDEGLKFGNKLSKSHLDFQRHKMSVKIAAQTLSSSVADALEYLIRAGHPHFLDAIGTICFIHIVDRLFYILNSRNTFGKGYKKPLFLHDMQMWQKLIQSSTEYLINLKISTGQHLATHRGKAFVLGLIVSAKVYSSCQSYF